ncbi:phosphatidate cytidylyltransferase [Clostridia bacterium]|nr:phosphatidate cytidylyltransferase [Clostridia bacterium]
MLRRTITGVVSAAILIACMFAPSSSLRWVVLLAAAWGVTEMLDAFQIAGHKPLRWPSFIALALVVPIQLTLTNGAPLPLIAVILMLTTGNIAVRKRPDWIDAAASLYAAFTIILPFLMLLEIDAAGSNGSGRVFVFASFVIPLSGDIAALFVGRAFGRHKLNPLLSPNKTWEGAAGGLIGSVIGALLLGGIGGMYINYLDIPPLWHWLLLGIFGGVAGQLGDFSASLVKRWCGIKDFGVVFPGHGGVMDRLDSVLFTSYIIYIYLIILL